MTTLFFLGFGILFSALGALTPGLINLAVAERTIKRGFRPGVITAFGAGTTELIYTFVAIFFIDTIAKNATIGRSIQWIAVTVFLVLGIHYLLKSPKLVKQTDSGSNRKHFGYGLAIAGMNMLIIPTWIFLGLWLRSLGYHFDKFTNIVLLAFGSALGATLVFIGYVYLGRFIVTKLERITRYTNKFLGVVFISLATIQLVRIYYY